MSIKSFYSKSNWRNLFGKKGPEYATYHHGHDIAAPGRTPVPALRSGTVVALNKSAVVGFYVIVQVGPEDFDIYCHVINHRVTKGQKVKAGQILTEVATWGDFTGSAWTGPHLHLANEPWAVVGTAQARDPRPLIEKALSAADTTADQEDDDMRIDEMKFHYHTVRKLVMVTCGRFAKGWVEFPDSVIGIGGERAFGEGRGTAGKNPISTDKEWNEIKKAAELVATAVPSPAGGGGASAAAVIDELSRRIAN